MRATSLGLALAVTVFGCGSAGTPSGSASGAPPPAPGSDSGAPPEPMPAPAPAAAPPMEQQPFRQARARDPRQRRWRSARRRAICRTSCQQPLDDGQRVHLVAFRTPRSTSTGGKATAAAPAHATSRCRPIGPWWRRSPGPGPSRWSHRHGLRSVDFLAPGDRLPRFVQHDRPDWHASDADGIPGRRLDLRGWGGPCQRRQRQRVQSWCVREPEGCGRASTARRDRPFDLHGHRAAGHGRDDSVPSTAMVRPHLRVRWGYERCVRHGRARPSMVHTAT